MVKCIGGLTRCDELHAGNPRRFVIAGRVVIIGAAQDE